ncbi:MAG: hypothetical protein Q7J85_01530 [Bacillota bacterium]|nr:hypothetical protein [Bacillota bacterium]
MSDKTGKHDETIKGLVEQYKENLRQLYREGKLSLHNLEEQLSHVVDSVNEELRNIATGVISEEDGEKKLPMPPVQTQSKNQQKSGTNSVSNHKRPGCIKTDLVSLSFLRDWFQHAGPDVGHGR